MACLDPVANLFRCWNPERGSDCRHLKISRSNIARQQILAAIVAPGGYPVPPLCPMASPPAIPSPRTMMDYDEDDRQRRNQKSSQRPIIQRLDVILGLMSYDYDG